MINYVAAMVVAVPVCRPARPARAHPSLGGAHNAWCTSIFWYGNAAARMFGRARRHRPYGFVWMDCAWNGWYRWGGLRVNSYFVCVGLRGKI